MIEKVLYLLWVCTCYSFIPQNEEALFSGSMLGKQVPAVFTYAEVMIMNVGLV